MQILSILLVLFASTGILAAKKAPPQYLKISKVKQASVLIGGKAGETIVSVMVGVGFHIQANPASQPNLIATELKLDLGEAFELSGVVYPEGRDYRLQNSDRILKTYDGEFDLKISVKAISGKAKLGKNELKGKLRFQPCNDKICFFPTTVPVVIPVMVYK